ncbi:hypothetical protein [Bailinhaonella thermotolerans]|uniref:hypothetical protein n=1 Tax=Bailinhaonella thermotolerans TaxID=1070861 RepID=UPI0011C460DC|nr:hypothetical protein [Bailinhaonella thermotolerans]
MGDWRAVTEWGDGAMVVCSGCGATGETTLGWTVDVGERAERCLCPRCGRDNLRSIESRLDPEWW